MPRKSVRVAYRTPRGHPDKPINLLGLLGSILAILVTVGGVLFSAIDSRTKNTVADSEKALRADCLAKADMLANRIDSKIDDIRRTTWPQFYTKTEIDERRKELDRRYDEEKQSLALIQQAIMELKLHDAQDHKR